MGKTVTAYLGLGSNVGDRAGNMKRALEYLAKRSSVSAVSPVYETAPVGYTDQPWFINIACSIETGLSAMELFRYGKLIELILGRVPLIRNAPRPIDIDILLYGKEIIDEPGLVVPHPRMHERAFVLVPLADIAPDAVHPILVKTAAELTRDIDRSGVTLIGRSLDQVEK